MRGEGHVSHRSTRDFHRSVCALLSCSPQQSHWQQTHPHRPVGVLYKHSFTFLKLLYSRTKRPLLVGDGWIPLLPISRDCFRLQSKGKGQARVVERQLPSVGRSIRGGSRLEGNQNNPEKGSRQSGRMLLLVRIISVWWLGQFS